MSGRPLYTPVMRQAAGALSRPLRGAARAIGARPGLFAAVAVAVFALQIVLPVVVLATVRAPLTYFTVNPWLRRLPEYLASGAPVEEKLGFLARVALFWFQADGPYGAPEWGFAVDTADLGRIALTALLFGVYFALWANRSRLPVPAGQIRRGRTSGLAGALASVLGLSTGPCSVVGCGAPVLPVLGLAFAGLSSSAVAALSALSRTVGVAVLLFLALGVGYLGWQAGGPSNDPLPRRRAPTDGLSAR